MISSASSLDVDLHLDVLLANDRMVTVDDAVEEVVDRRRARG